MTSDEHNNDLDRQENDSSSCHVFDKDNFSGGCTSAIAVTFSIPTNTTSSVITSLSTNSVPTSSLTIPSALSSSVLKSATFLSSNTNPLSSANCVPSLFSTAKSTPYSSSSSCTANSIPSPSSTINSGPSPSFTPNSTLSSSLTTNPIPFLTTTSSDSSKSHSKLYHAANALKLKSPVKTSFRSKDYDPDFEAKPYKCGDTLCMHKFSSQSSLDEHSKCHVQGGSHHFMCPHCSEELPKWIQCALHLWKCHRIDVDLYTCKICDEYKTTTKKQLESHIKIHSDKRPYECQDCGKGFKQRTQLINHTVSVHIKDKANAPKWYMSQKCEICFKTYADSKCLKKHMQAVHSKLKPYKCQICGHMSARKSMLQAHVRQHTGEKPFTCQTCPFKTGDHNSLRRHVMRHTGKRSYLCPHCPYSSIQSSSFKSHLVSRHPGQGGLYICAHCQFVTINEQSYQHHLSDHKLDLIPPNSLDVFPENLAAAHLVYQSFGASPSRLHSDVTGSSTSQDGTKQTITITIASKESGTTDDEDTVHGFTTGDELDTGGITIPAEPDTICISKKVV